VEAAARRLAGRIERTPWVPLPGPAGGREIHLKLENRQLTRSFKPRGAQNCALRAAEREQPAGLVTYSSGNHGQATALAAQRLGVPCIVVSPEDVRPLKRNAMEERGTVGLEIDEQAEELALVVSPVGGGGLISGIAIALAGRRPGLPVWGVEPDGADDARRSLACGELQSNSGPSTSACDGLRNSRLGDLNWSVIKERVAGIASVPDEEVAVAGARLDAAGFGPVEPSGAAALAAVLHGRIPLPDGPVGCIVSGGNASGPS
jgi:threonine dehydratase